jgi:ABC-2 type transport system permease protein
MSGVQGADAEIFDRGYRSYNGRRTGVNGAIKTVITQSIRAVLGLGRSARHKVIPVAVVAMAFVPAIVFVGLAALLPDELGDEFLPTYAEYYGFIITAMFLFAAFVAPELLCTDRRSGLLGVYLASPLDRTTYLLAKLLAIMALLGLVTVGPPLLLLIALSIEGSGPDGIGDFLKVLWRIALSGVMVSLFFSALSMAVSATTDRKGAATATTLGLFVGTAAVSNILVDNGYSTKNLLYNVLLLPQELTFRIHGENSGNMRGVDTELLWLALVGAIVACGLWVWLRYRQLLVRR